MNDALLADRVGRRPELSQLHARREVEEKLTDANPFDYLNELQRHAKEAAAAPAEWMPWNFREAMAKSAGTGATP